MAESFASLKRSRDTSMDRLTKELDKFSNTTKKNEDDRFWKAEVDKSGNGYAVIRFLPAPQGEDLPWVRLWNHGFQGPGGWYIENSLTTLNEKDPAGELNSKLWNSGNEKDKETARKHKHNHKHTHTHTLRETVHERTSHTLVVVSYYPNREI